MCISRTLFTIACIILCPAIAWANEFMVSPMSVEFEARPGQNYSIPIEVNNHATGKGVLQLKTYLSPLGQDSQGNLQVVSNPPQGAMRENGSVGEWAAIPQAELAMASLETREFLLNVHIPPHARGTYYGALVVETVPPENVSGVAIVIRFLIPIFVEVQGGHARIEPVVGECGMRFGSYGERDNEVKGAFSWFDIENGSEFLSMVSGRIITIAKDGPRPVMMADKELEPFPVLPGAKVQFTDYLGRDLPAGTYELRMHLDANGRQLRTLTQEIAYPGNPAYLAAGKRVFCRVTPEIVELNVRPGSRTGGTFEIENLGSGDITVTSDLADYAHPEGARQSQAFSAASWGEVRPGSFDLRAGRKRNVRVMFSAPKEQAGAPYRYALAHLKAADNQGEEEMVGSVVFALRDAGITPEYLLEARGLRVAPAKGNVWEVPLSLVNKGNAHVEARLQGQLTQGAGGEAHSQMTFGRDSLLIMPGQEATAVGQLEAGNIKVGQYVLEVVVSYADKREVVRRAVQVSRKDGRTSLVLK